MEPKPQEWNESTDYALTAKFPKFHAKHPREFKSLFANLKKVMDLLHGNKWGSFQLGFFRSEGDGVFRLGQTAVAHAKESRLYVFPDTETNTMFVLSIGDKDTQEADIQESKEIVAKIRAARQVK